ILIRHKPGLHVTAMNERWNRRLLPCSTDTKRWSRRLLPSSSDTIIYAHPNPEFDRSEWRLGSTQNEHLVPLELLVERIWWRIQREHAAVDQWSARAVLLENSDFVANSTSEIRVLLPHERWTRRVEVGFAEDYFRRSYSSGASVRHLVVPLREFEHVFTDL